MVYHIVFFKLNDGVDVDSLMRQTRSQLLKIQAVRSVRCGKKIVEENEWPFFLSIELDSMEKLEMYRTDPIHVKFVEEVIKPNTSERWALDFELDPGKDVRYS